MKASLLFLILVLLGCQAAPAQQENENIVVDLYGIHPEMKTLLEQIQEAEIHLEQARTNLLTECDEAERLVTGIRKNLNPKDGEYLQKHCTESKLDIAVYYNHCMLAFSFLMNSLILKAEEGRPPTQTQSVSVESTIKSSRECERRLNYHTSILKQIRAELLSEQERITQGH